MHHDVLNFPVPKVGHVDVVALAVVTTHLEHAGLYSYKAIIAVKTWLKNARLALIEKKTSLSIMEVLKKRGIRWRL